MTPQINGTLQSLKQEASGLSIDDCRNISVKEVKGAFGEMMDEAKARVKDATVEIVETQAQEAIDHVAESVGVDKENIPQNGQFLSSVKKDLSRKGINDCRKFLAKELKGAVDGKIAETKASLKDAADKIDGALQSAASKFSEAQSALKDVAAGIKVANGRKVLMKDHEDN